MSIVNGAGAEIDAGGAFGPGAALMLPAVICAAPD
jgi:hypothetical protein